LLGAGKKTKEWARVRAKLKPKFYNAGITSCELGWEGCWGDNARGFAHAQKRWHVEDLEEVILACNPCHETLERRPEEEMTFIVRAIREARIKQP
jgi:hypothetical protein